MFLLFHIYFFFHQKHKMKKGICFPFMLCVHSLPVLYNKSTFSNCFIATHETEVMGGPLFIFLLLHIDTVHIAVFLPTCCLHDSETRCDIIYASDKIMTVSSCGGLLQESFFCLDSLRHQRSLNPRPLSNKCIRSLISNHEGKLKSFVCCDTEGRDSL